MLTVKIAKSDGNERLFEAWEVSKERHGILVQTDGNTEFYGPEGQSFCLDAAIRRDGPMCPEGNEPSVATAYVMNRFGATVATYRI